MDTPDHKTQITPTSSISKFEDSPVFIDIDSLSPIELAKSRKSRFSAKRRHFSAASNSKDLQSGNECNTPVFIDVDSLSPIELAKSRKSRQHFSAASNSEDLQSGNECNTPVFIDIDSLSPIELAKSRKSRYHFSAASNSEDLQSGNECNKSEGASKANVQSDLYDKHLGCPTNGNSSKGIGSDLLDEKSDLPIELPRTLKYDCGSPDGNLEPCDNITKSTGAEERQQSFENERDLCKIRQIKSEEIAGCDWVAIVSDVADLLTINSSIIHENTDGQDQRTEESGDPGGPCKQSELGEPVADQTPCLLSTCLPDKVVARDSGLQKDDKVEKCNQSSRQQCSIIRRCLVFEKSAGFGLSSNSIPNTSKGQNPLSKTSLSSMKRGEVPHDNTTVVIENSSEAHSDVHEADCMSPEKKSSIGCIEPSLCQDCFNKPVHENMVLETCRQIESRNPQGVAPEAIRSTDTILDSEGETNKTPASARHKRGCSCRRSSCLKKYCECFQVGVGCSHSCRCEGCKNSFGRKEGGDEFGASEMNASEKDSGNFVPNEDKNLQRWTIGGQGFRPLSSSDQSYPSPSSSPFPAASGTALPRGSGSPTTTFSPSPIITGTPSLDDPLVDSQTAGASPIAASPSAAPTSLPAVNDGSTRTFPATVDPSVPNDPANAVQRDSYDRQRVHLVLDQDGCWSFHPRSKYSRQITKFMKRRIDVSGYKWATVSQKTKILYWEDFKKLYFWDEDMEQLVKKTFDSMAKQRYKDMAGGWSHSKKQPQYISDEAWAEFQQYWATEEFKKRSEIAKKNRRSTTGGPGPSHTGGSISYTEHRERMTKDLGRDPGSFELFQRTHTKKDNKTDGWVDQRSRAVANKYQAALAAAIAASQTEGLVESAAPSVDHDQIYLEAAGGVDKRKRVYGLGSQASSFYSFSRASSSTGKTYRVPPEVIEQLRQQATADVQRDKEQMAQTYQTLQSQLQQTQSTLQLTQAQFESEVNRRVQEQITLIQQQHQVDMSQMQQLMLEQQQKISSFEQRFQQIDSFFTMQSGSGLPPLYPRPPPSGGAQEDSDSEHYSSDDS
ncbi:hypothetical protein PTKIN_Ptkin06aG0191800 [Pterospermum kingtungense]